MSGVMVPEPTGWPVVGSIVADPHLRNLMAVWECPECFALTINAERHKQACRPSVRRLAPCDIRAGQLLDKTCACGHVGFVHGFGPIGIKCTACPA